jgi:tetratricopeptide (TPR) repeat protein
MLTEWLYGRIIDRLKELGDSRLVAAARYGPLLRSFTMRSLNALLPEEVERLDQAAFRRFTGYAFVKNIPNGWTFHELMRDVQQAYLIRQDDPEVETCHHRATAFFQERADATGDPEAVRNALYHACFLDPEAVFDKWDNETFQAQLAGDRGWWAELLAVMEARGQYHRLGQSQQGRLAQRRGMWYVRNYNMDAALASYGQALELFRAVGDRLGEANTLKAIGNLKLGQEQAEGALQLFEQAMELYQQIGDRVGQANIHWTLGSHLVGRGALKEAEPLLVQAVELGHQIAPGHPTIAGWQATLEQVRSQLRDSAQDS